MESEDSLEEYLTTAPVEYVLDLPGGGGHSEKKTLVLRGGVGVAAKPGHDPMAIEQARNEVAAWLVAREVEMRDLVPMTVMRQVPAPGGGEVEGSAQILWPRFVVAQQGGFTHVQCPDDLGWRIAVFDYLISNTDRNDGNWGAVNGLPNAVLIDHGHSFTRGNVTSPFFQVRDGRAVPAELVASVQVFLDGQASSRLSEVLRAEIVEGVFGRARNITTTGLLTIV